MIHRPQRFADVVQQRADDEFLVGPVAPGARRRLQAVVEPIDRIRHISPHVGEQTE